MKCKPSAKERNQRGLANVCFRCIRNTHYINKYDFSYECSNDVMKKMDQEEFNELAKSVLDAIRNNFSVNAEFEELYLLGDCYARVFMYTITRGHYLRGSYQSLYEVRETVQIASEVSMPAWGICDMFEPGRFEMPRCWLDMNDGYNQGRR